MKHLHISSVAFLHMGDMLRVLLSAPGLARASLVLSWCSADSHSIPAASLTEFAGREVRLGRVVADPASYESVRTELEESEEITVIPERVIAGWTAGRPETEHDEGYLYKPEEEKYYEEHEPAEGLKLLGYPIRGQCPR